MSEKQEIEELSYTEAKARLKPIEWENENKMKIETGHKTFDRQTNIITTGNVIANTMTGKCIRAFNETIGPVGQVEAPGYYQNWDLKGTGLPLPVRESVKRFSHDRGVILYSFFHYKGRMKYEHGYLVTTYDFRYLYMWTFSTYGYRARPKSLQVMFGVMPYLCWQETGEPCQK